MPMPLSRTSKLNSWAAPVLARSTAGCALTSSDTSPCGVNFTAFDIRLNRICLSRLPSASTHCGTESATTTCRRRPLASALITINACTSRSRRRRSWRCGTMSSRPDSSLEMSRMSSSKSSRWLADCRAVLRWSVCSASSRLFSSSANMPSMPLNGVRSSWLMLARKALLAWLAASAPMRASCSRRATCCSSRRRRARARNWRTVSSAKAAVSRLWKIVSPMPRRIWSRTASLRSPICSAITWLLRSDRSCTAMRSGAKSASALLMLGAVNGGIADSASVASCRCTKPCSRAQVGAWSGPISASGFTRSGATSGRRLANSSNRRRTRSSASAPGCAWASRRVSRNCRNSRSSW